MTTRLIYRIENLNTGEGPWDYKGTQCLLSQAWDYACIDWGIKNIAVGRWGRATYWGFTSIKQLVKYFTHVHEAPEYMCLAVYECDAQEVMADRTQAVFNMKNAVRLHRAPCTDVLAIREWQNV